MTTARARYDAIMLVSFGGPEGPGDVMPFLERVTAGRDVPKERLAAVADQYLAFAGISPINQNNRDLLEALADSLERDGIDLPIYWGNRNWHPLLADSMSQVAADGHESILAIVTSAFGSYSGCRQYTEDIERAVAEAGVTLTVHKSRLYWNHPGFLKAVADRTAAALAEVDPEQLPTTRLVFTAHSIPTGWTAHSPYVGQLRSAAQHTAEQVGLETSWDLAFQSRSGSPLVPWLEPDIRDHLDDLHHRGISTAVVVPIGFVSDHMEVVYDLDVQARITADELGITMIRAKTPGTHPEFVGALHGLVTEALTGSPPLVATGEPWPNPCARECCLTTIAP